MNLATLHTRRGSSRDRVAQLPRPARVTVEGEPGKDFPQRVRRNVRRHWASYRAPIGTRWPLLIDHPVTMRRVRNDAVSETACSDGASTPRVNQSLGNQQLRHRFWTPQTMCMLNQFRSFDRHGACFFNPR
jgi:hypothetical protein